MLSSLKRLTAIAGVSCAIVGVGPVALASAATPSPTFTSGLPSLTLPGWPGSSGSSGSSCSTNQGLFPGFINLGPTGPLGPLGPNGPLGNGNKNLPCGSAVFNLGPSGPLGPGGLLGSGGPLGTGSGQP
jgi:hypothetical protein